MKENRKKIAIVAIAALVVLALIVAGLRGCSQQEQQGPDNSVSVEKENNTPGPDIDNGDNSSTGGGDKSTTTPAPDASEDASKTTTDTKKDDTKTDSSGKKPDETGTKPGGAGTKPGQDAETTPKPSGKTDPVQGTDYTVPNGLKGTAGNKLSTVSLGNSHLVWSNPNEILSASKRLYKAKFVGTSTKNEKIVWVAVTVTKTNPVEGTDYTIPTGLKGTSGNKLSSVSLGNSHLVWSNPNETLTTGKTQYEARFVETDTKNGITVKVKVTVQKDSGNGGGSDATKTDPVEGTDYTIPTGLKGTAGNKLSTVSLGNSHLVWSNPNGVLLAGKTQYEAKFVGTSTKNEKVVLVTVTVTKANPVEGTDYTIPTGLKGTSGNKLSSVSLGNSHLVWSNPNETLTTGKTQYEARFVETDTKNGISVMVKVTVQKDSGNGGDTGDPDKPGTDPDKPGTDPDKPGTDPDKPGTDPDKPGTDPDKPTTDPDKPATDPDKPGTNPDKPVTDPDKPATDPDKPATDPDKPATNPDKPATDPDKPVTDPDKPATDPDKPATDPDKPATNPDTPAANPDAPATNPDTPVTNPDTPVANPDTPATNPDTPAANPDAPATNPDTPVTNPDTPAANPDTPATNPDKPATNPDTPTMVPSAPSTNFDTPVTVPSMPTTIPSEPVTVPNTPVTSLDIPEMGANEPKEEQETEKVEEQEAEEAK